MKVKGTRASKEQHEGSTRITVRSFNFKPLPRGRSCTGLAQSLARSACYCCCCCCWHGRHVIVVVVVGTVGMLLLSLARSACCCCRWHGRHVIVVVVAVVVVVGTVGLLLMTRSFPNKGSTRVTQGNGQHKGSTRATQGNGQHKGGHKGNTRHWLMHILSFWLGLASSPTVVQTSRFSRLVGSCSHKLRPPKARATANQAQQTSDAPQAEDLGGQVHLQGG